MADEKMTEEAKYMLMFMGLIRKAALEGDELARPYLEADAIRVVDGDVQFHKGRFLQLMGEQMEQIPVEKTIS